MAIWLSSVARPRSRPGPTVQGDLVVIGGSLRMDGQVSNSAIVIGGSASLGDSSTVGT